MRILPTALILAAIAAIAPAATTAGAQSRTPVRDCSRVPTAERRDCEREVERIERDRRRAAAQRERERIEREAERAAERAADRNVDMEFDFDFDFDFDDDARDSRNLPSSIDTVVALAGPGALAELSLGSGEIVVSTWNRPQARVVATSREGGVRLLTSEGMLSVQVRGHGGEPRGRIEVTVPVGTRIQASGQSVDVGVRGTRARVRVNTMNGDVVLDDVAELVELNSISGDLVVSNVTGDVELRTVNGDVQLSNARGDVVVQSVSGDAEVRNVVAKRVRVLTVSGDMLYEGSIDPDGRYSFSTTSGDVDVITPRDVNASVTLRTFSGEISSVFPITLQPGEHRIGAATGKRFTFDVGRGGAALSLESFSGTITLGQQGVSPAGTPRQ